MAEKSLSVSIAGRAYPITVTEGEDELVLKIAAMINDKIKHFEKNYAVRDKQDLLAMTALNLLVTLHNAPPKSPELEKEINQLDLFVADFLKKQE
jgi:cell division protein ZapA